MCSAVVAALMAVPRSSAMRPGLVRLPVGPGARLVPLARVRGRLDSAGLADEFDRRAATQTLALGRYHSGAGRIWMP